MLNREKRSQRCPTALGPSAPREGRSVREENSRTDGSDHSLRSHNSPVRAEHVVVAKPRLPRIWCPAQPGHAMLDARGTKWQGSPRLSIQ